MACYHKFYDDIFAVNTLEFHPRTLIVGTFNPEWPEHNYAPWFYGRVKNNYFWDILPALYGEPGLRTGTPEQWRRCCARHGILLTDLISCIDDADPHNPEHRRRIGSYSDSALATFANPRPTPVVSILCRYPSIDSVYLTTRIRSGPIAKLWLPVERYCLQHGLRFGRLMTPSGNARFFKPRHCMLTLAEYILQEWKRVMEQPEPQRPPTEE